MFPFVVRYFGFLKSLPLVPQYFDSLLKLWMLLVKPNMHDWLDEIETEVSNWEGMTTDLHHYGGIQFNYHEMEIGHVHSHGLLDVLLNRKLKSILMRERRIMPHHVFPHSGWISFLIRSDDDKNYALHLLRMARDRKCGRQILCTHNE